MRFEYYGTTWLKEGFVFPGLFQYIEETKERLRQPLKIPEYATVREEERIRRISEKVRDDPYLNRALYAEAAKREGQGIENIRTIPYGEYPALYEICMFASKKLTGVLPIIFLYTAQDGGALYNASALDYQDKVWIYISDQFFKEHGMLKPEELCFLVGHELGHAQCHHSTIASAKDDSSDTEYSADRAGMIVCAGWILQNDPARGPEETARLAALYGASALLKLEIACANGRNGTDWGSFRYDHVQEQLERVFDGASRLSVSGGSHPHTRHRIMAMIHFSQSQLLYRCLGLDPAAYPGLHTDKHLRTLMAYQLKDA